MPDLVMRGNSLSLEIVTIKTNTLDKQAKFSFAPVLLIDLLKTITLFFFFPNERLNNRKKQPLESHCYSPNSFEALNLLKGSHLLLVGGMGTGH